MYLLVLTGIVALTPQAQVRPIESNRESMTIPVPVDISTPRTLNATFSPVNLSPRNMGEQRLLDCPQVTVSNTDSTFQSGSYNMQAGFAEGESLAATYSVPPEDFPIKINVMDVLFATSNASVQTTTHWSVRVWDGTPLNGILIATFSSDDIIIPHLVMPPGTAGMIISVSVDPQDPDQIFILNESGTNSFTVAFRIDQHNAPGAPCLTPPATNLNAFPVTDTSGLDFPIDNWVDAASGTLCLCGTGWLTFLDLPSFCTPTGDWVMRASYTPINCIEVSSACCFSDASCSDLIPSECAIFGGTSVAEGTTCATYICGSGVGACCVPSTGSCADIDAAMCLVVGGIHNGEGTACASTTCFPMGACCLPSGSCIDPVSPDACLAVGGAFQGDGVTCAAAACPQPLGECCSPTWCFDLTEINCTAVGGDWSGANTVCQGSGGCLPVCIEDINGDGLINVLDLLTVVAEWASTTSDADLDGSGVVDTADLLMVIGAWGSC